MPNKPKGTGTETAQVDAWLRSKGIDCGLVRLAKKSSHAPKCVPALLKLLAQPWSPVTRATLAQALFERGPSPSQKRKAMKLVLAALKDCPAKDAKGIAALARVVYGSAVLKGKGIVNNIDKTFVHDVGAMLLDAKYGKSRDAFTHALREIGNADAITYLEKAVTDREVASCALTALRHLREDTRTLALCEKALKIPHVVDRAGIEYNRHWIQKHIGSDTEEAEVDAWLQEKGVKYTLGQLCDKPALRPECVPLLLDLLKKPFCNDVHGVIGHALFDRKPSPVVKRKAIDTIIARIERLAAAGDAKNSSLPFETLITGEFADNIGKDRVHEIGRMMLDKKFGGLRDNFPSVLSTIGGEDAISYLRKAAADPEIASYSLHHLAEMRVEGTLELCEKALANPRIRYKDAIKETYQKLKRRMAKKPAGPSHATSAPIPKGLEEWSATVGMAELSRVLRTLSRFVQAGFGKPEIAEVRAAADELDVDQDARFKFDATAGGKPVPVWIEVFMDDIDTPDLAVYAAPELIKEFEKRVPVK